MLARSPRDEQKFPSSRGFFLSKTSSKWGSTSGNSKEYEGWIAFIFSGNVGILRFPFEFVWFDAKDQPLSFLRLNASLVSNMSNWQNSRTSTTRKDKQLIFLFVICTHSNSFFFSEISDFVHPWRSQTFRQIVAISFTSSMCNTNGYDGYDG